MFIVIHNTIKCESMPRALEMIVRILDNYDNRSVFSLQSWDSCSIWRAVGFIVIQYSHVVRYWCCLNATSSMVAYFKYRLPETSRPNLPYPLEIGLGKAINFVGNNISITLRHVGFERTADVWGMIDNSPQALLTSLMTSRQTVATSGVTAWTMTCACHVTLDDCYWQRLCCCCCWRCSLHRCHTHCCLYWWCDWCWCWLASADQPASATRWASYYNRSVCRCRSSPANFGRVYCCKTHNHSYSLLIIWNV